MKINSIVKYTKEYLNVISKLPYEDREREFVILSISDDLLLIKNKDDKTCFSKKHLNEYWVYEVFENEN